MFLVLFAVACGSINRVIPTDSAMKTDVKGKIAEVYPAEATQIGVTVDHSVVTCRAFSRERTPCGRPIA